MEILIVSCGATVADICQWHRAVTGEKLLFEKLWPDDPRGSYGEYVLWAKESFALAVLTRYARVARAV